MDAATLGNFISTQRKELGMTQKELAEKINVTDKAISKWERGAGLPDISMLEPLAEALEINLAELMSCEIKDMEAEQIDNESVKETLDYANLKIRNTIKCCIPAIIFSWLLLFLGVFILHFYVEVGIIRDIFCCLIIFNASQIIRILKILLTRQ